MFRNLILFFILLYFSSSFAQSGGINFTLAFPQGEFKDNIDRLGFGGSLQFLFFDPKPGLPVSFGINFGYLNYGSETRREPFSPNIPDVVVDVDRTNNLVNFHVLFQIIPYSGTFRPYAEGLFGGSYIFTETTIKSRGVEEVASSTNFDDFAWSYGAGGGFIILLMENIGDDVGSLYLDLKARYLFGSEAEYLKEGSVKVENGRVTYDVSKSKTDLLQIHLGVVAYFNIVY
ncbi:MAG: hypothetical protein A2V93_01555 [Ignavibacteria bacterium RBG_16_34_14]|nr:MAG: hypothetical protein A2V93_01555 [Ignavibacteria bacterium RBG_16_34_14]